MRRGDIVVAVMPGDYGKPRPALVVQAERFDDTPSVTVLPITSIVIDAPLLRVNIGTDGGLERPSQIQIDKLHTPLRKRVAKVIGRADAATMTEVNRALVLFLGLA